MPEPQIGADEVLVRVRACALNHLDIWVRNGLPGLQIEMPHIGGSDIAGEVARVGANVKKLAVGRRVVISPGICEEWDEYAAAGYDSASPSYDLMGLRRQGGYAEFAKAHQNDVLPVSDKLSF